MITLSNDSDIMDTSLEEQISIDRKANILECFRLVNMEVSSRYTKTDLAEIYDIFFHRDTGWILNKIPKAEWPILFALLLKKQDEYVTYPMNDQQFLFLQKCYLVITYQTKDTWHLYMCDDIRNTIKETLSGSTSEFPSLQEMKVMMDRVKDAIGQKMETVENIPERIYRQWKKTLRKPDDSIFYYHPSLERIILGLTMYAIASRPYLNKLGKAESLKVFNIYINEMVTAWIDETDGFEYPFNTLMTLSDAFPYVTQAFSSQHPGLKKVIRDLQNTFCYWTSVAGDMSTEKADELLDDISTDGKRIDSEKIAQLVKRIQPIVVSRGLELDPMEGLQLIENDTMSS